MRREGVFDCLRKRKREREMKEGRKEGRKKLKGREESSVSGSSMEFH